MEYEIRLDGGVKSIYHPVNDNHGNACGKRIDKGNVRIIIIKRLNFHDL